MWRPRSQSLRGVWGDRDGGSGNAGGAVAEEPGPHVRDEIMRLAERDEAGLVQATEGLVVEDYFQCRQIVVQLGNRTRPDDGDTGGRGPAGTTPYAPFRGDWAAIRQLDRPLCSRG